ncbi:MAG: DUF4013 domain-containing protein [Myxococcales bacterium]|nr:DUF4013 domain-containing protein [Myxococcales bacterium]MCB9577955.1 DUF4013 domain-containing protein [Polyangiaceae bacterium]
MQPPWQAEAPAQDVGYAPGPGSSRGVSVIDAVKAVFEDPEWKHNVMFAVIFMVIPIAGPIAMAGWFCEAQQRLVRRHPQPIPYIDFSDFGEYLRRGLTVFLVQIVMTIPVLIIVYGFIALAAVGTAGVIAATDEPAIGIAVGGLLGLIALMVMLGVSAFVNAAQTRAELTENFSEALSMGKVFAYGKATFWRVMIKNFAFMFVAVGIVLLGMMLCYVGIYPAAIVLQIAAMRLRFMIYDDYLARGGEPIPVKPAQLLPSEARAQAQGAWAG